MVCVFVGLWVCGCVNEVCVEVTGRGERCVGVGMGVWVCGCVNEVCMEVTGCGERCVGVGVGVYLEMWVSEFWTSDIVANTHYMSTVCLTQFGQNVG